MNWRRVLNYDLTVLHERLYGASLLYRLLSWSMVALCLSGAFLWIFLSALSLGPVWGALMVLCTVLIWLFPVFGNRRRRRDAPDSSTGDDDTREFVGASVGPGPRTRSGADAKAWPN